MFKKIWVLETAEESEYTETLEIWDYEPSTEEVWKYLKEYGMDVTTLRESRMHIKPKSSLKQMKRMRKISNLCQLLREYDELTDYLDIIRGVVNYHRSREYLDQQISYYWQAFRIYRRRLKYIEEESEY